MTHVLTLIADPAFHALADRAVTRAMEVLGDAGAPVWLSPEEACDVPFTPEAARTAVRVGESVRDALGGEPVDIVCQRADKRRKRLLVADMDSTLIGQECIDELAGFAGFRDKISAITERAMRGEIDFEPALRERVGLLAGLDESVLDEVFETRITLNPGARTLARTMRANGATTLIVSGGFTFFTGRVAAAAGFDSHQANVLDISGGKLTGLVNKPILGRRAKLETLLRFREKLGLGQAETIAVGDGANDLPMLKEAGLGIAYRAKPVVAAGAHARIEHGDLTALLFAQGYARRDFVED